MARTPHCVQDDELGPGTRSDQLLDRALPFAGGIHPVLMAVELRVRERHTAGRLTKYLRSRGLSVSSVVEAGCRAHVRVAPSIENHARDVGAWVEPGSAKQPNELLANPHLVVAIARRKHLRARRSRLGFD